MYKRAITAQQYYAGDNPTILNRLKWFWNSNGQHSEDEFKANNKIPSEFFNKIVKQENSYLLSNGVNFNDETETIKQAFPKNFDSDIFAAGNYSLIDGVSWIFANINQGRVNLNIFRGSEFIPLLDERTSVLMAGIRFWQIDIDKPIWIELFEIDGKTEYKDINGSVSIYRDKEPYEYRVEKNPLEERIEVISNYSMLPIFPLYANELGYSTLTQALQNKIDIYDLVLSDFANNLEDSEDVYWVLKNYGGQNLETFLSSFKKYKTIKTNGEDSDATPHTIDVPFEARKVMLEMLKKDIFESAMALNTEDLTGSSLTTTAIKANMMNLDLKTDVFEMNALDTLNNLTEFYLEATNQNLEYNIQLIRRTLVNDQEVVDMIYASREDLSRQEALRLNPLVPNERIEQIIQEIEDEGINFNNIDEEVIKVEE